MAMLWATRTYPLPGGQGHRVAVDLDGRPATTHEVLLAWRDDRAFRTRFNAALADSPFSAFRWETPPVTTAILAQPFEFVLLDSPSLTRRPDSQAFADHFSQRMNVVEFPNLGKDAILIVPCPIAAPAAYIHLASFVREAPEHQQHALWRLVGEAMERRLGAKPVWLSTAGAGVPWLHVRLDDRPKYYGYAPYRRLREAGP